MKVIGNQELNIALYPSSQIQSLNIFHLGNKVSLEIGFYNWKEADKFMTKCQKIAGNGKLDCFLINSEKTMVVEGLEQVEYKSNSFSDSIYKFISGNLNILVKFSKYAPSVTLAHGIPN